MTAANGIAAGRPANRPFVMVSQPSLFDDTRAPAGKHVVWAYCHVPNASRADMTGAILAQLERFAPGIGSRILGQSTMGPAALETYNANYVGGDINGASRTWPSFGRGRRSASTCTARRTPASSSASSTPPGGGVHGLCGYHAARSALRGGCASRPSRRQGRQHGPRSPSQVPSSWMAAETAGQASAGASASA